MSTSTSPGFWSRFGLNEENVSHCIRAVQDMYQGYEMQEFEEQGYCSFTFLVTPHPDILVSSNDYKVVRTTCESNRKEKDSLIVQLRPAQHALCSSITEGAKETYAPLAPTIRCLDLKLPRQLYAYEMQKMRGAPLSRLLPQIRNIDSAMRVKQRQLVKSFATIIAQSWPSDPISQPRYRPTRADSPMQEAPSWHSHCLGKVGSSIISRLRKLSDNLPDTRLRQVAESALARVQAMEDYPVVLNHGDLIPSNILVDEDTWEITGLVDWAEAEYLPFGICLYGLENLLGYISLSPPDDSSKSNDTPIFLYYDSALDLRDLFWASLLEVVPELKMRQDDVRAMRDVGVLLWYGYAWDDGAIDRVVNERDDAVEVTCLRAFLGAS